MSIFRKWFPKKNEFIELSNRFEEYKDRLMRTNEELFEKGREISWLFSCIEELKKDKRDLNTQLENSFNQRWVHAQKINKITKKYIELAETNFRLLEENRELKTSTK